MLKSLYDGRYNILFKRTEQTKHALTHDDETLKFVFKTHFGDLTNSS